MRYDTRRTRRSVRRAFTLMEIIVVVTIIALLATLVAPRLLGQLGGAKKNVAKAGTSNLASAVTLYITDIGRTSVPEDMDLTILLVGPDAGGGPNGPYIAKAEDLLDPWGNPYELIVPGEINPDFDVVSFGEDGVPGGEGVNADITN
jgi:general secretion pathway protein G